VEHREWWYRREFEVDAVPSADRVLLTFDGLDTFAAVYLNGEQVASSENMFVPLAIDIAGRVKRGKNLAAVRFDSTTERIEAQHWKPDWAAFYEPRVWARKAQMSFGWDWGPRLATAGIWRPARITTYIAGRILSVFAQPYQVSEKRATVFVHVEVDAFNSAQDLSVEAALSREGGELVLTAPVQHDGAVLRFDIEKPALWWTHDLGEPNLYQLRVRLMAGGREVDSWQESIGIRSIELLQDPGNEIGVRNFTFCLNGVRVFARGANWIPCDNLIGSIPAQRRRDHVELAREANMNMLRIWGGGIYEADEFYQACDELGLLLWHDFMFSCAGYPDHDAGFMANVEREIAAQLRRLRNHPCIALWCGNNENQWIDDMLHWNEPGRQLPGRRIYDELLPAMCAGLDPTRPYWPSSPYGGSDHNSAEEGDRHNWSVWAGQVYPRRFGEQPRADTSPEAVAFKNYARDTARFVSEFGLHGSPPLETLSQNIPAGELELDSEEFRFRIKDPDVERKNRLMETFTGIPGGLGEYADWSMLTQAEGLKFGIEHYRRRKFECSGSLFWQFNDCWPGISWSVLDYYLRPKAAYHYVRRAFEPLLLSFKEEEENGLSVWLTNDALREWQGTITLALCSFEGEVKWERKVQGAVSANASCSVARVSERDLADADPARDFLVARSEHAISNRHFFRPYKEQVYPPCSLRASASKIGESGGLAKWVVRVSSDRFARFVVIEPVVRADRMSDNYFDIYPGEEHEVTLLADSKVREISVRALNMKGEPLALALM
jgi:beta-mannosidase